MKTYITTITHLFLSLLFITDAASQNKISDNCKPFTLKIISNSKYDSIKLFYNNCNNSGGGSAIIFKNGEAVVSGQVDGATEGLLFASPKEKNLDGPGIIRFVIEPRDMTIAYTLTGDSVTNLKITGSATELQKQQWQAANIYPGNPTKKIVSSASEYISSNPASYLSGFLLRRYIKKIPVDSSIAYYTALSDKVKYSDFGKQVLKEILAVTDDTSFREQNSSALYFEQFKAIKNFHDIKLPDQDGQLISMSQYEGKYVVVDFWGSWCVPCIKNVPALHQLKNDMKNLPVEFVSVSLDNNLQEWNDAVKKYNYPGLNVIDTLQVVANFYKVPWVPVYIIICPDGNVINTNAPQPISGNLKPLLLSILNKKD